MTKNASFKILLTATLILNPFYTAHATSSQTKSDVTRQKSLSNKDYAVLFSTTRFVGSYVLLQGMAGVTSPVDVGWLKKSYKIDERSTLPKVELKGNFLQFEGLSKKLDLTNLNKGEIYDGKTFFRFVKSDSAQKNIERLIVYLEPTGKKVGKFELQNLFIPSAHASSWWDTIVGAAEVAVGLYAAAAAVSAATAGSIGALIAAGSVGAAAAVAGGVIVMAAAAETLIKLGIRTMNGTSVVCKNGVLFLKKSDGEMVSLAGPDGGTIENMAEYFSHAEIGAAELATRRLLCSDPKALAELNGTIAKGFDEASLGGSDGSSGTTK